jgi:hypothetical protein
MFQYVSYVACSSFVYFTDLHCICQKTTRPWPATEINRDQLALEVPFPPGSPSPWSRTVPFWIPASHSVGATMVSGKSYRTHPHLKLSSKIFSETKPLILKNLYTSSNWNDVIWGWFPLPTIIYDVMVMWLYFTTQWMILPLFPMELSFSLCLSYKGNLSRRMHKVHSSWIGT